MLATRMAPKPPSPPAAAFEGNDACACRSSNEARPRMTNIPLLRTVLTRSPSEGPRHLRRASGSSEPGHAIRAVSLDSTRTFDRDAFDRLLPPKPIYGEHPRLVCSRLVFRGLRLVLARQGWDPSIAFRARARRQQREAWDRSMQQGRGTVRFTTRGFASADRALSRGAFSAPARRARSSL